MVDEGIKLVQNWGQIWAKHALKPQKQVFVWLYGGCICLVVWGRIIYNELSSHVIKGDNTLYGKWGRICMWTNVHGDEFAVDGFVVDELFGDESSGSPKKLSESSEILLMENSLNS